MLLVGELPLLLVVVVSLLFSRAQVYEWSVASPLSLSLSLGFARKHVCCVCYAYINVSGEWACLGVCVYEHTSQCTIEGGSSVFEIAGFESSSASSSSFPSRFTADGLSSPHSILWNSAVITCTH